MTTTTPQRIGGWLLGPLAWLLVALLVRRWRCCCIPLRYLLRKHFKRSADKH